MEITEITIERAMQEAEGICGLIAGELRYEAMRFATAFREDPENAQAKIGVLRASLRDIRTRLEEASNILQPLTDPAEPEYNVPSL